MVADADAVSAHASTEEDGQAGDGGEGHIAQDSAKANPTAKVMGQPTPEFLNWSWTADVSRRRRCFHNSWASRCRLVSEEDLRTWLKVYVTLYSNHDWIFYSSDFSSAIAIFH
ncbi:hypothetical protein V8E53_000677 [Lactarius tabidus]